MPYSPATMMDTEETLQKYHLLTSQQEVIRRRLSLQLPSPPSLSTSTPEFQSLNHSLSSSPTSYRPCWTSPSSPSTSFSQATVSTYPIPVQQPSLAHRRSVSEEENTNEDMNRLNEINHQIKATLTDLLNTESVRQDRKYRSWIQERLMDAEHEIRRQRRHRSVGDKEMAERIGEHLEP